MHKRTAALILSGTLATGVVGAVALTPASAATSTNPISHRLAELRNALSGLVSDGTLTKAQADKVATTLDSKLRRRGPDGRRGGPGRELFMQERAAAAKVLGLTPEQLRTQLQSGKSLADVAKAQKVDVNTLVSTLVTVAKDQIAVDVKAGRLTQARADMISAELTQRITDRVNQVRPDHGPGDRGGPGHDGPDADGPDGAAASGTAPASPQG